MIYHIWVLSFTKGCSPSPGHQTKAAKGLFEKLVKPVITLLLLLQEVHQCVPAVAPALICSHNQAVSIGRMAHSRLLFVVHCIVLLYWIIWDFFSGRRCMVVDFERPATVSITRQSSDGAEIWGYVQVRKDN